MDEQILSVRNLSVIRHYEADVPFPEFCRLYRTLPYEEERSLRVLSAVLLEDGDGSRLTVAEEEGGGSTVVRHRKEKGGITVLRRGELSSEMRFLPGEVTSFCYVTPFGTLDGEIYTLTATFAIEKGRGSVTVEYLASLGGALQKNTVRYTVV